MSIARLLVMGALCGMRSIMPAALVSHRVEQQTNGEGNCCGLGTPAVTGVLTGLAALEVVGDKTPWIGPRIAPVPLIGRASTQHVAHRHVGPKATYARDGGPGQYDSEDRLGAENRMRRFHVRRARSSGPPAPKTPKRFQRLSKTSGVVH